VIDFRFNWAHMAMLGLAVAWAGADRVGMQELGLCRGNLGRSAACGWGLGGVGLLVARLLIALPGLGQRVVISEMAQLRGSRLFRALFLQLLLGSAVLEEFAFRGLLQAKLERAFGRRTSLIMGSGVFALWHALIAWHNIRRFNPGPRLFAALYSGVMVTLFAVGMVLGQIRCTTGNLAGGIITHWLLCVGMVLAVARKGEEPDGTEIANESE